MHLDKLLEYISKIDIKYSTALDSYMNSLLQEIMDADDYYDNGPKVISTPEILENITDTVDVNASDIMCSSALEFCITNDYPLYEKTWNCIDYLLTEYKTWFTASERKYLTALNNSYMSIYKVISVEAGSSVTLQCQVEEKAPKIVVFDKALSNSGIPKGIYLATRVLTISPTSKNSKHILSAVCFEIPKQLVKECITVIRNIMWAMQNSLAMQLFGDNEIIEDTKRNQLLAKKMWSKEILETWYLHYANYADNQEVLDADGNPWHPCIVEFDLTAPSSKVRQALRFIPKFKFDEGCKDGNTWLWLEDKTPAVNDNCGRSIFAGIKLDKNKLIVDVHSRQRANIAQDIILTELGSMLSNPKILSES